MFEMEFTRFLSFPYGTEFRALYAAGPAEKGGFPRGRAKSGGARRRYGLRFSLRANRQLSGSRPATIPFWTRMNSIIDGIKFHFSRYHGAHADLSPPHREPGTCRTS